MVKINIMPVIELPLSIAGTPFCDNPDCNCPYYRRSTGCFLFEVNLEVDPESQRSLRCDKCLKAEQLYAQFKNLMS